MPYEQEVARPQGFDTGTDRQGGSSTPLGVASGLAAGLATPIDSGLDPQLEAELKQKYMRLYSDITVQESRLQQETVETYGALQSSLLSAQANLLGSMAEGAKAKAMSDQALASYMRLYDGMTDASAELVYFEPDQNAWSQWSATMNGMDAQVQNHLNISGTSVTPGTDYNTAAGRYIQVMNDSEIRADSQIVGRMTETANNLADDPVSRTSTLMQQYGSAKHQVYQSFALMASKDNQNWTEEQLMQATNQYMATYVDPMVFGQGGQGGLLTEQDRNLHEQKVTMAEQHLERVWEESKRIGAGLDPKAVKEAQVALRQAQQIVGGGPMAFADQVSGMPTPQGTQKTKAMIEAELARLQQGPIDPLVKAQQDIMQVPGFDVWMQAMGFTNVTRAMVYAGNHPYEFKTAVRAYVEATNGSGDAPRSAQTPAGMREYLRMKGDEEGLGFHVTPLERAVGKVTGNRNFAWQSGWLRKRLEAYEPRSEFGGRIRAGLRAAFGLDDGPTGARRYPEGRDAEGLEGEHFVDVIEEEVAGRERRGAIQEDGATNPDQAQQAAPAYRDVPGAGGYTYRQHPDGRIEIVAGTKSGRSVEVQQGSAAYAAILREIGPYEAPAAAAPQAPPAEDGSLNLDQNLEEERFLELARTANQVEHPPGKAGKPYKVAKLGVEDGGWTVRVYEDGMIQVVDAPGFNEQVGASFAPGTYQHDELLKGVGRAKSTTPVAPADTGADIEFGKVDPKEITVERQPQRRAAPAAPQQPKTVRLYWQPPGNNPPRVVEVERGSEDERWWKETRGAYEEGKKAAKPAAKPAAAKPQAKAKAPKKKREAALDPGAMVAQGYPESNADTGSTNTGTSW